MGRALQGLGRNDEAKPLLAAGQNAAVNWYRDELGSELLAYVLTTPALSAEGTAAKARGDFAGAAEIFERLVKRKPEDADMLSNLGACQIELGHYERAAEVLAKALTVAPQSFAVHLNLSELHLRQNKLPEARAEAVRAVEIGGTVAPTHFQLARVLGVMNDYEGAYGELKAAAAMDARDVRVYLALTETAAHLARTEEARGWCRRALDLDANSVPGLGLQATLALTAGDLDEAQVAVTALEQFAPQDPRTLRLRSELQKAGR
jgi:tetratricopeptide (TPR) repeat protein